MDDPASIPIGKYFITNAPGFTASADYIKSFSGPLKTFSITSVIFLVYEHINHDFGKINRLNFAGKLYFLFYDTDIDLIRLAGGSRTKRWGTISKNKQFGCTF